MSVADPAAPSTRAAAPPCCPVCGGPLSQEKCKTVCLRCHALIANCNGD